MKAVGARVLEVFPAYAGMSRSHSRADSPKPRFPRLRGDEPRHGARAGDMGQFSPPTRG